jgi:hypothetical protein
MGLDVVLVCTDHFIDGARLRLAHARNTQVTLISIPHPFLGFSESWKARVVAELPKKIYHAYQHYVASPKVEAFDCTNALLHEAYDEVVEVKSFETFNRMAEERSWSDGLPVIPPTAKRVEKFTSRWHLDPETEVARVPPLQGVATVSKIAANAVMAGCAPEYLLVLIAALKAATIPDFRLDLIQTTTSPATTMMVVNGSEAKRLGINAGTNALGPGCRANSTIGRAFRLIAKNIGGAIPGVVDMSTQGQPAKYSFCFAENEEASPWESCASEAGFSSGESTVIIIPSSGQLQIPDSESKTAYDLLQTLATSLSPFGIVGHSGESILDGVLTMLLCPEHAMILAEEGLTKNEVRQKIWEQSGVEAGALSETNLKKLARLREAKGLPSAFSRLPITKRPENIILIVVGGPGRKSSFVPGWGRSLPAICPIDATTPLKGNPVPLLEALLANVRI